MVYSNDVEALRVQNPILADGLSGITNLDRAFRYLESLRFPISEMDVVAQDEFSHDLYVPFPERTNYLVFGVT